MMNRTEAGMFFVLGAASVAALFFIASHFLRSECQKDLPRSQKCVMVFMPEDAIARQGGENPK